MDLDTLSKIANFGLGGFAAFAFSKKWFVPGWVYEAEKSRADKYEQLYYQLMGELKQSAQRVAATTS